MSHDFPLLRAAVAEGHEAADYDELTAICESVYGPGVTPEDVESFFSDVGRGLQSAAKSVGNFAQKAAPMVAKALPNIAQGAAAGSAFGPWGALVGGVAGGASGILQQSGNRTARDIGKGIHQVGSLASSIRGGGAGALGALTRGSAGGGTNGLANAIFGAAGRGGAGGTGAAGNLLGMLARPEMLQSLLAGQMGQHGRRAVQVGAQRVPVHTMLSALGTVAGRAAGEAAEWAEDAEQTPPFILAAGESLGIDPEDAEGRSDALITLLALSPAIWGNRQSPVVVNVPASDPAFAWPEWLEDTESDEAFDELSWEAETWEADEDEWAESEAWHG